jgi:hypothetical protein
MIIFYLISTPYCKFPPEPPPAPHPPIHTLVPSRPIYTKTHTNDTTKSETSYLHSFFLNKPKMLKVFKVIKALSNK